MASRDKILIVEDNAIVAADIKARVTSQGYDVIACVSRGEAAVEKALADPPDLILMDVKLKGEMSGIEAAATIRAQFDIPVIFLTSYTDEETLQSAKATEPYGYIVKPFEDNELRTTIEISLYKHRTERQLRESEEKFKLLFEYAPLPYQSLDESGHFLEVNKAWLDILGYQREEVIGKFFGDFLHHDWRDHFAENFPRFKSIGEILGVEFDMRRKDGSYLTVHFNGKIGKDALGGFMQTHCVFRDVTKEVQLQRQIEAQEAAIRQSQKLEAMGTLAGGIAHDFNNILAAVIGYTELCLGEIEEGSELHENMAEVFAAGNRAKELVKQILTFSQQGDEEKKPVNLSPMVSESVKMLRSTTPASIELRESVTLQRAIINGNSSQINQILVNLITNAVHAIDENGEIEVGLEQVEIDGMNHEHVPDLKSGSYVRLYVRDNGKGIASEHQDTIFDPYFTTKPPDKGSGLGLAVVHGIVTSHGGYIDVASEQGKGTRFDILLPLTKLRETGDRIIAADAPPGGDENILVVDDEPALTIIQQRSLQRLGYTVTACSDGETALHKLQENPGHFDLVITDMTMPGFDGLQLAEKVKSVNPKIKIILCTGYSEDINLDTWQSTVLDALFMKPVENDKLAEAVRKLLDSRDD